MKQEWVKSDEAARIVGCTVSNLYNIIHKDRHRKIVRRRKIKNDKSGGSPLLYNRADCEELAAIRAKQGLKRSGALVPMDTGNEPRMWHQAMIKPWNAEGLRGVFG